MLTPLQLVALQEASAAGAYFWIVLLELYLSYKSWFLGAGANGETSAAQQNRDCDADTVGAMRRCPTMSATAAPLGCLLIPREAVSALQSPDRRRICPRAGQVPRQYLALVLENLQLVCRQPRTRVFGMPCGERRGIQHPVRTWDSGPRSQPWKTAFIRIMETNFSMKDRYIEPFRITVALGCCMFVME